MAPSTTTTAATATTNEEMRVSSSSAPGTGGTKRPIATSSTQPSAGVSARIISGSVGSLITALAVTPLEVVKVHLQNAKPVTTPTPVSSVVPKNASLCPKGCGTFVLNNGLTDCVLAKCSVPYFDKYGNLKCLDPPAATTVSAKLPKAAVSAASTATQQQQQQQLGTFGMIRSIFVKEGFRGIYAGLGPTLVMGIPSTAFYYTVYDELVALARSNPHIAASATADAYVPLVAGSSARLLSTLLTAPLELIRTRQASMVGEGKQVSRGMMSEFRFIVQQEGYGALYKGLAPTLWRDVPFSGIYWLCLEQFQQFFATTLLSDDNPKPTSLQQAGISFLSGASAGMVAAACTTPFDVVKTRQQAVTETMESAVRTAEVSAVECATCNHDGHLVYRATPTAAQASRSSSVFAYMRTIYETEGIQGLWRGNQTRMIKVAPSCAIMITCYELGKRMLEPNKM